ncbi:MAG: Rrf2 family transcriptional regulator [Lentisphaerae bacterium]|nr:Rrf2 family transcriptional regulator [Lentisphaerota bacterium]
MRVSRKTDYALRALVALAEQRERGGLLSIRSLAAGHGIPRRFLEQIMIDLRERGWVRAVAGRDGGYQLAVPPEAVTMGQVVRFFDGVLAPIGCVSVTHYEPCSQEPSCRFRRVFLEARNHAAQRLDAMTLADLTRCTPVAPDEFQARGFGGGSGI